MEAKDNRGKCPQCEAKRHPRAEHCPECKREFHRIVRGPHIFPDEYCEEAMLQVLSVERCKQAGKCGQQDHDNGRWLAILMEEVGDASKEILDGEDPHKMRHEVTQVMAVAFAWRAAIERRYLESLPDTGV